MPHWRRRTRIDHTPKKLVLSNDQNAVIVKCLKLLGSLPPDDQLNALAVVCRVAVSDDGNDLQRRLRQECGLEVTR